MATGPFGSSISSQFFRTSGVPVIRGGNLSADSAVRLDDSNLVFLEPKKASEFSRSVVRAGDLVFTSWGTINQVGLIDSSAAYNEYIISNKQMKLTPDPDVASPEFLYYLFSAPEMQRVILEGSIGSSIPGFNLARLKSLIVDLPSINEQRIIAEMLNDAENFESNLRELLAKKQAIKQGMMQQLLTGRTRLPGFSDDRHAVPIGSLGTFSKGRGIRRDDVRRSGIPCIRYGEIYTTYRDYTGTTVSFVDCEVAETSLPISTGDVLFAVSGETREEIGLCVAYIGTEPAVAGGDTVVLRGTSFNPVFLSAAVNAPAVSAQKARLGQGDAVVHISSHALASIEVLVPNRAEQDAIAEVIMDADSELEALQRRLDKARDIKTGMMQQLLTGRARLPVDTKS